MKTMKVMEAGDIGPESASLTATYTITLSEYEGTAWVSWSETFPGKVRLAVAVYSGAEPRNPNDWINAYEVTYAKTGTWNSRLPWGTGYSASLLAVDATEDAWVSLGCNTPVTGDSA